MGKVERQALGRGDAIIIRMKLHFAAVMASQCSADYQSEGDNRNE